MECIFCAIAAGELAADVVAENEAAIAFRDRSPVAPTHVLVIPRKHIASVLDLTAEDGPAALGCLRLCAEVAALDGIDETGLRVVANSGPDAGQSVFHLHFHVLGGRRLTEMA